MRNVRSLLIAVACLSLATACSSKDKDNKKKAPVKPKPTKPTTDKKPPATKPKPVEVPITCLRVLNAKLVADGEGSVKATMDGKPINATHDAKAKYKQNMVWAGVSTPAACAKLMGDKLTLVAFYKDAGKPVVTLHLTGLPGGEYKFDGKMRQATGMVWHDERPWKLQFKKGSVTISPAKLTKGKFSVKVSKGEGTAMTKGKQAKFTLEGTFSATLPPAVGVPAPKKNK